MSVSDTSGFQPVGLWPGTGHYAYVCVVCGSLVLGIGQHRAWHESRPASPFHRSQGSPVSGPHVEGPLVPTTENHRRWDSDRGRWIYPEDDFAERVAKRLESTSTYVDVEQDVVDGLFSDVIDAVRAEMERH